jgi:hypothetical protein
MAKTFGFNQDELKLLLVAVRHMRRTFEHARNATPEGKEAVEAYAGLYDDLFDKLHDMIGPIPDHVEDVLEK